MTINTYGTLKTAVASWLERADTDQQIPDFIALAIATLNKVLRDTRMIGTATVSLSQGDRYGAVPSDMIDPVFVTNSTNEDSGLEERSIDALVALRQRRMPGQGVPRFYSIVGRRIEVCPTPAATTTLEISYYQQIPALVSDGDTNWVLTYQPDILLYTALLHAATYLKDDAKTALFGSMVAQQIQTAVQTNTTVSPGQ